MRIGILPQPERHGDWEAIKALLEPAAIRGGVPVLEENEVVWAIYDGPDLMGAATARLTHDGFGEVVLVGGRDARDWIHQLDWLIGHWMRREGMTSVRAYGRKGWMRVLRGWHVLGKDNAAVGYERAL